MKVADISNISNHKVFCAFGAYAVSVADPNKTTVKLLVEAKEISTPITEQLLISVNLNKRIGTAAWGDAFLDDVGLYKDGTPKDHKQQFERPDNENGIDVLTLGPVFFGPHRGGIYIERALFFNEIRPRMDPQYQRWPYSNLHTYQVMSSASQGVDKINRYHGFHAEVIADFGSRKLLAVKVFRPERVVNVEVDFAKREDCDDPLLLDIAIQDPHRLDKPEKVLKLDAPLGTEGAVFLALDKCAILSLRGPKEPPGGG